MDSGTMGGRDRQWTVGQWEGEIESEQLDDGKGRVLGVDSSIMEIWKRLMSLWWN